MDVREKQIRKDAVTELYMNFVAEAVNVHNSPAAIERAVKGYVESWRARIAEIEAA